MFVVSVIAEFCLDATPWEREAEISVCNKADIMRKSLLSCLTVQALYSANEECHVCTGALFLITLQSLCAALPLACDFGCNLWLFKIIWWECCCTYYNRLTTVVILEIILMSHQINGVRLVASTYSPWVQTLPSITSFFCSSVLVKGWFI